MLLFDSVVSSQQLAFPTAEGWGKNASGGRGGFVCHVDITNSGVSGNIISGTPHHRGTWEYCITRPGARTVVFDTSGQIDGANAFPNITNGNMTIAGQSSPGQGVDIRRFLLSLRSNNHIVRHVRIRPGPGVSNTFSFKALDTWADNMIFDHLSVTYSWDDSIGIWSNSNDITLQWSIIAQGMPPAGAGEYSKSSLVGAGASRVTFHHNLHAHHKERAPYLQSGDFQQVNDIFYNIKDFSIGMWSSNTVPIRAEFINNHLKIGPNPDAQSPMALTHFGCNGANNGAPYTCNQSQQNASSYYLSGNFHTIRRPTGTEPEIDIVRNTPPFPVYEFTLNPAPYGTFPIIDSTTSHQQAYTDVISIVGARKPVLANSDLIIINDVENGTGQLHRDITLSDYDTIPVVTRSPSFDTDSDGIPDAWETFCSSSLGGLDPNNSTDGSNIISGIDPAVDGYSKLEIYLNELAGDYDSVPLNGDGLNTCGGLLAQSDTENPVVTITAPTSNATYLTSIDPITTIAGNATDNIGVVSISWDNAATSGSGSGSGCSGETSCNWSVSSIDLNEGANAITITATDAATNTGTDIITVTLDTSPPSTPSMNAPSVISSSQIDLSWSASTDGESGISGYTVVYCVDGGSQTCSPNTSIQLGDVTSYSHMSLSPSTTYGYQVKAINGASLESSLSTPVVYATTNSSGADITTGLVSHWTFDDVLTDAGSAGADGSFVGGTPSYLQAKVNNGIDLNGSTQYVTVLDNAAHDFGTSTDFSYALWVKKDVSSDSSLIMKGQEEGGVSDGSWYLVWVQSSARLEVVVTPDTWNDYCGVGSSVNIADSAWHHIAVNISRNASCLTSDIEVYIDGTLDASRSVIYSSANTNVDLTNNDPLWIGAYNQGGTPSGLHDGMIDDVRVYNRQLAQIDIDALVALGAPTGISFPSAPTNLTASPSASASFASEPSSISTSASPTPSMPGQPSSLSTTAGTTPAFPGNPTGLIKQ